MRAFVTGGTGFVGSHLVEALAARGDTVTALVRTPERARFLKSLGVTLVGGDLADQDALLAGATAQDVVFHVAGAVAAPDEAAYMAANRDGTANLVRAAELAGVPRFVLVSSMAAGGPSRSGVPHAFADTRAPVTAYGRSKLAGEEVLAASSLNWIALRPPVIYGPRDSDNFIKLFRTLKFGILPVFGDGSQQVSLIYAPDLAEALLAAVPTDVGNGVFYVNHPELVTTRELTRALAQSAGRRVRTVPLPAPVVALALAATGRVARLLGRTTILNADKAHEFNAEAWTADPSPFEERSGWKARHDLQAGLRATYRWYLENGWLQ